MTHVSSQADVRRSDYRFERMRHDRMYIPLEQSEPPIHGWRWDIIATLIVVALGYVAFPVAEMFVELMARWF